MACAGVLQRGVGLPNPRAVVGRWALVFLLGAIAAPTAQAAEVKRLALLPLRIHAAPEMHYLQDGFQAMLSARLHDPDALEPISRQRVARILPAAPLELSAAAARDLGRRLRADYLVAGSVTLIGTGLSLDLTVFDVSGRRPPETFYEQTGDLSESLAVLNRLAVGMKHWLTGKPQVPATAGAGTATSSTDVSVSREAQRHPETLFREKSVLRTAPPPAAPAETSGQPAVGPQRHGGDEEKPVSVPAVPIDPPARSSFPERIAQSSGQPERTLTIQVAAMRTEAAASRLAAELDRRGYAARVERADLAEKGIWFRVRVGGFASESAAAAALERLRREGFSPLLFSTRNAR